MNNIILAIIELLGGMGAFLLGFKVLSESIEKLASAGLKRLFNKTSKNRFIGVGIGALVTAIIQSSSATTVMIVGFVNAGVMNLFQATTMIWEPISELRLQPKLWLYKVLILLHMLLSLLL